MLTNYINYLQYELVATRKYDLDRVQIRVFNEILFAYSGGYKIRVGDILANRDIASQATSHAALKMLASKKLIRYLLTSDSRTKNIAITKLGLLHFKGLAKWFNAK